MERMLLFITTTACKEVCCEGYALHAPLFLFLLRGNVYSIHYVVIAVFYARY